MKCPCFYLNVFSPVSLFFPDGQKRLRYVYLLHVTFHKTRGQGSTRSTACQGQGGRGGHRQVKSYSMSYSYVEKRDSCTSVYWKGCLNTEASHTGISLTQEERLTISYVVGKLSFTDAPKIYDEGSNLAGKVRLPGLHLIAVILDADLSQ